MSRLNKEDAIDKNKQGVYKWLIEAMKAYDGKMSQSPTKEEKWEAKLRLQAVILDLIREVRKPNALDKYLEAGGDPEYVIISKSYFDNSVVKLKEADND